MNAQAHLRDWYDLMSNENPLRSVVWMAGGSDENESMVVFHLKVLQQSLIDAFPQIG